MSDTKEEILRLGEQLIRDKGYNAFSYQDISGKLSIKNAAVHYHFPKKSMLAAQVLRDTRVMFEQLMEDHRQATATEKLRAFFDIYKRSSEEHKICLVGAMITDYNTLDEQVSQELKLVMDEILTAVKDTLKEGRNTGEFYFKEKARTKALLIITNMIAALQVARVTGQDDYNKIEQAVIEGLTRP